MNNWLLIALSTAIVVSCRKVDPVVPTLVDGRTLSDLASTSDSTLIFAVDPGECFGCSRDIRTLIEKSRRNPDAVKVVLTRTPDLAEKRALLIARITVGGIIDEGMTSGSLATIVNHEIQSIRSLAALRARVVDSAGGR